MGPTIYASFETAELAEKAAGALLDHGLDSDDISIIANETYANTRNPETLYGEPVSQGVDPAYRDRIVADVESSDAAVSDEYNTTITDRNLDTDPADRDYSPTVTNRDDTTDRNDPVNAAAHGITTTTGADAASGAAKGAGIGLGVGALAALASLVVPGFGLVLGGGALATALAGAAGATVAGAAAGGVTGFLKDQGVDDEATVRYSETIQRGGAILAVTIPMDDEDVDRIEIENVLAKYGATNVGQYGTTTRAM